MPNSFKFKNKLKEEISNFKEQKDRFVKTIEDQPMVDLRFLHQSNKCIKYALDEIRSDSRTDRDKFIDCFQKFIFDFSTQTSISDALRMYSSHNNGSNLDYKKYKYLINVLPESVQSIAKDELIHLHLKPNGNGEHILIGFCLEDIFFILAVDPKHRLI
ncbi:hypothetical protein [Bulleidia sp. zg-1006]|uniref:hypothetical protein n=1 Tax=Bulleidia sp. zg-1006 TaxID=2806552 RepID=UPI00193ABEB2|nr:hypothetical protein [Bulleidia sp. zg-1006]QRG86384.1 hypothetical protein JOS54_05890 [Bulleidia sp. zg-1006]